MEDKKEYSRMLVKRSTFPGATPTIPTGTTLSTFNVTDIFEGELYANLVDDKLWWRSSNAIIPIQTGVAAADIYVTGGTYSAGTASFSNSTGGTFNVTGFYTGSTITKTYAELSTLVSTSALTKDATYYISDRKIWIKALDTNLLSESALRKLTIIKDSAYHGTGTLGVWNSTLTPSIGNKVIWGGRLWSNLTGAVGSKDDDITLDGTNWSLITSNSIYYDKIFEIGYDFSINKVNLTKDNRGNIIYFDDNEGDWSIYCDLGNKYIYGNTSTFIANNHGNCYIYDNHGDILASSIKENISSVIYGNIFKVGISRNSIDTIYRNVNCFGIYSNSGWSSIYGNVGANISDNTSTGYGYINNNISIDISQNHNTGDISNNKVDLITNNTSNVNNISINIGYQINLNANSLNINNNNCYSINNNGTNVTTIQNNINIGVRSNNNTGTIEWNTNAGEVFSNTSNVDNITYNNNNGDITSNSITGNISNNSNNGYISSNTQTSGTCNIINNNNNGYISGARITNVAGTIVNL